MNWQEVCEHPHFQNLPFKIELEKDGLNMLSVRGIYENGKVSLLEPIPHRKKKVAVIVTLLDDESGQTQLTKKIGKTTKTHRPIGLAKDIFQVPGSFFDELPDEILDAFEGRSE